jgi:hypothetical protein
VARAASNPVFFHNRIGKSDHDLIVQGSAAEQSASEIPKPPCLAGELDQGFTEHPIVLIDCHRA